MYWIIVPLIVLGIICCVPDVRFYIGLVWQALRDSRGKKPPLAGA